MIGTASNLGVRLMRAGWMAALMWAVSGCDGGVSSNAPNQNSVAAQAEPAHISSGGGISQDKIEQSLAAAQEYLNSGDVVKAQAILVTLIDRAPREVRARELYGQSLIDQAQQANDGELASRLRLQAYEQYRIAVELAPEVAGLQQSAGMMALAAGQPDAAVDHFRAARKLDERNPQYPLFEAQVLIAAKRLPEAEAVLRHVIELDANEPIAHASLAMIALERNDFGRALKSLAIARRIQPEDVDLRAQEAKIHRRKGDAKRALELLIGLGPADRAREVVAFEIAKAYGDIGEPLKAAKAWEHCYQSNPSAPRAWFAAANAGMELLNAGEREQATLWMHQAELAGTNQPEVIALRDALSR